MSYNLSFHKDPKLFHNVKYRNAFAAGAEWSGIVVNIGNFAHKNLYCDNSVEVGIGRTSPNIGNYQLATNCNYIKIVWDGKTVIGLITGWEYINDSNVSISYSVDAFMSAMVSGFIEEMNGLCERVNLLPSGMLVNDQPEPFAPSDIPVANPALTASLNSTVFSFEGVEISASGTEAGGTCFVLTVSALIDEYCGNMGAWATDPVILIQRLTSRGNLSFYGGGTTKHSGGVFVGIPYKFTTIQKVQLFIEGILGGCGFRTELSEDGAEGQNATTHRQYLVDANTAGGQAYNETKNSASDPMEAIRFITEYDIFNLYCIPEKFASEGVKHHQSFINGMKSLGSLTSYGSMAQRHNKQLCYPFYYNRLKTANGDETTIVPQTHWLNIDTPIPDPRLWLYLRFVGGDTPRIMGNFAVRKNESVSPTEPAFVGDWFTVRSYPAIPINIENSYNQQIQNDVANTRQVSAVHINKQISRQISNPIKQGYTDSVNNASSRINTAQGGVPRIFGGLGSGLGAIDKFGANLGFADGATGGGLFSDVAAVDAWSQHRTNEAGNIISISPSVRMGNNFMTQYSVPAFGAYDCGATESEHFTFARYLEEFGAACGCYLNPITNAGNLFGGSATVEAINARTFYQYSNIQINGTMPIEWKNKIKQLFESGVYLLD